jgi:hypothetical protein
MTRKARAVPFARKRRDSLLQDIPTASMTHGSKHLLIARKILIEELGLADARAKAVLIDSYRAAHSSAQAINQRSRDIADFAARARFRKIFKRMAKCARRSPARLRCVLDHDVASAIENDIVDSESAEALIHALVAAFASSPEEASSLAVLRALTHSSLPKYGELDRRSLRRCFAEASDFLQEDYSALQATDQRSIESALTELRKNDLESNAADVCESIANALGDDKVIDPAIHDLITEYVAAVVDVWLQHGIKPTRSVRFSHPNYRGKFHRFADLVLTAAVEPWSKRHDDDQHQLSERLRNAHAQLPSDIRKFVSGAPRRCDVEWLVSDDHVRRALSRG